MSTQVPLTVAIDGRCLAGEPTGVGRYLVSVVREILVLDPAIRFRLLFDRAVGGPFEGEPRVEVRALAGRGRNILSWTQIHLPRLLREPGCDVAHFPFYFGPLRSPVPNVVSIHDVTFAAHPEWFPRRARLTFGLFAPVSARRAACVLTCSETSRNDLIARYRLDPAGVLAAPYGVDAGFAPRLPGEVEAVLARLGLVQPYLLHLGSIHPRRNLERLIAAVGSLAAPPVLVLAGRFELPYRGLADLGASRVRVVHLGYVADADLAALIGGAVALVYPSLYEGFGLPVLEAMACGTPVVTSRVSSLPEVAGDAALLVDPTSTAAIAAALREILERPDLRARLAALGLERARAFPWRRAAEATLAAYRAALKY